MVLMMNFYLKAKVRFFLETKQRNYNLYVHLQHDLSVIPRKIQTK